MHGVDAQQCASTIYMPKRLVNIKGINNEVYPFLYFSSITNLVPQNLRALVPLKNYSKTNAPKASLVKPFN